MKSKYFAFDVETTGLDEKVDQIISFAFVVLDDELNKLDYGEFHAHPNDDVIVSPQAAAINGYSKEAWDKKCAKTQGEMFDQIDFALTMHSHKEMLVPMGYNVRFDVKFLDQLYKKHDSDLGAYLKKDVLCVMEYLKKHDVKNKLRPVIGYKLIQSCERFGVRLDNAHTANADIDATIEIYKKIKKGENDNAI